MDRVAVFVATGLYISYIPRWIAERTGLARGRWTGAGLAGTALGWALLYALPEEGAGFGLCLLAGLGAAVWASHAADLSFGSHDDPRIVADEVVGFWVAAWGLPRELPALAAAFALFRVLDALKPPPCRWLERLPGGLGVVMDDVGAGLLANLALRFFFR